MVAMLLKALGTESESNSDFLREWMTLNITARLCSDCDLAKRHQLLKFCLILILLKLCLIFIVHYVKNCIRVQQFFPIMIFSYKH